MLLTELCTASNTTALMKLPGIHQQRPRWRVVDIGGLHTPRPYQLLMAELVTQRDTSKRMHGGRLVPVGNSPDLQLTIAAEFADALRDSSQLFLLFTCLLQMEPALLVTALNNWRRSQSQRQNHSKRQNQSRSLLAANSRCRR